MKITKRQLRRIIKEEKVSMLREQPISGEQATQMQSAQDTATQLGLINDAVSALLNAGMNPEELAGELYGIADSVTDLDAFQPDYSDVMENVAKSKVVPRTHEEWIDWATSGIES